MTFLAVSPNGDVQLNIESLLGYLEFHTVPNLRIHKDDLAALWKKHNLPQEFLPREIRPCDAFRRATATGQQTVQVNWNGGRYSARLLVREVKSDDSEIVRLLVREVVDSKNEVLDYAIAGKITFQRSNNTVSSQCEWHLTREYGYDAVLQQMEANYLEFINYHTGDTVRNLVQRVVRACNPVCIVRRSQGKFIPRKNHPLLLGLKALLSDLQPYANGEECRLDLIPVINSADQRELVARRASAELAAELDDLVAELADRLKKGSETNLNTAQRLTNRALELQDRVREYEKLLNVRMSVLRSQLNEFVNRVRIAPVDERQAI